jgi:hypothetical protein
MKITLQHIDVREQSKEKKIEDLTIGDFDIKLEMVNRCEYLCYENDHRHKILKNRFGEAGVILSA